MYIVMGGTGHVGSATTAALLAKKVPVSIVMRDKHRARHWRSTGAQVVEANVNDVSSLNSAFRGGRRAFLLNPPADVSGDTDRAERRTVANILAALDGSGLEKIVAQSTSGARSGDRLGDLSVLWEFEQELLSQPIPVAINRGGYYMSNWDAMLEPARTTGKLPSMFDPDLPIPMVAPLDLGAAAARRLMSNLDDVGIRYIEGPDRYTASQVALAFSRALKRDVQTDVIPRDKWEDSFRRLGFSSTAAESYARMIAVSVDNGFDVSDDAWKGAVTLDTYIRELVDRTPARVRKPTSQCTSGRTPSD